MKKKSESEKDKNYYRVISWKFGNHIPNCLYLRSYKQRPCNCGWQDFCKEDSNRE